MREIRPYGSVRGVRRNPYPYRDPTPPDAEGGAVLDSPRYRTVTPLRRPELTPHRAGIATPLTRHHGADRRLTPTTQEWNRQNGKAAPQTGAAREAAKEKNLRRAVRPRPVAHASICNPQIKKATIAAINAKNAALR